MQSTWDGRSLAGVFDGRDKFEIGNSLSHQSRIIVKTDLKGRRELDRVGDDSVL